MKAIMLMFDSLRRDFLPPYGNDWVHAPNFQRLAARAATFDASYVGSMPCMPARREIHTGRHNFLHAGWGCLEPFDDSMPEILGDHGVYTHVASDHYHYWEDFGTNYLTKFQTHDFIRGQEGDAWKGEVAEPEIPVFLGKNRRQDWVNRKYLAREEELPIARTVAAGLEFLATNRDQDNWFLTIECFDPHEPYYTAQQYLDLYPHAYDGIHFDWPPYREVQDTETPEMIAHVRALYAAMVSMCDAYLGKVLDFMDAHDLWQDTMLIVNTDHGTMLSEHGYWEKNHCPMFEELVHTPLFIWDPRCGVAGARRGSLVQTIDLAPTVLDYFGIAPTRDMQGHSLRETIAHDAPVREAALMGYFGSWLNVTDGRYTLQVGRPGGEGLPLDEYTLLPNRLRPHLRQGVPFELSLAAPFSFTKGCEILRVRRRTDEGARPHMLFDQQADPRQETPITNAEVEARLLAQAAAIMAAHEAPPEMMARYGMAAANPASA